VPDDRRLANCQVKVGCLQLDDRVQQFIDDN